MTIGALCNREVIVTGGHTTAADAAQLMRRHHVGDLVVVEPGDGRRPLEPASIAPPAGRRDVNRWSANRTQPQAGSRSTI
jgi:CBS domain-containing protein